MKLCWSKDHNSVILIAETPAEVAMAELVLKGMNYHRLATTSKGKRIVKARWTIIPEENKQ